jgi:hypothetical protein
MVQMQLDGKRWHDGSLMVMDGEGRHKRNGDEPQVQWQWTAMDGALTTQW